MTAAGSSTENEVDRELVQKINYKLKSQGYFDQFRKEFIADVDTKPAYKNLQQRVESYVSRFLSQQKWSSDLNKNNLRETLRRQINQSGMLNKGVERIVEQVVNPKILQLIKPKVDEVTCEHLGISLEARNSEMKKKQLAQQEKMMKSPETAGIPSILSLSFNSPPPGSNLNPFGSPVTSLPQSQYTQVPPGTGLLGPAPATSFAQQIANPFSNPAGLTFPGISQQLFPFLPPGWNASLSAGFPPVFPPGLPFQNFSIPPPNATLTVPPPLASGITSSPMVLAVSTTSVTTRPSQGKGLNALLGLPTPSEEPPPPGTVVLPDGTHIHKKKQEDEETERTLPQRLERINTESESSETDQAGLTKRLVAIDSSSENELPFIPLPEGYPSPATKSSMDNQNVEDSTDVDFETEDEKNENADGKRPYKFAWNEEMEINEDEVNDSEVSSVHTCDVSSVHTSDLSEFEESDNEKEKAIEELENKLLLLQNEEGIGHVEEMAVELATEDVEALVEEVEAVEAPVEEETTPTDISFTPAEPSPVKQAPEVTAAPGTGVLKGDGAKPAKPRKLLSLQYNYSDSEDEETREERKERIAKEKEERYQKRLQRRAEMEAKRKEREEERARQKRDRLEQTGEAVADQAADKGESENIREDEPEITSDIEAEIEDNDIVETSMTDSEVQEKTVEAEAEAEAEKEKEEAEGPEEVKQDGTDEGEAEAVEETEADEHIVEESTEQKEEAEPEEKEDSPATTESVEPAPVSTDVTERLDQDTSMTAAEMSLTTETSSAHDTSLAEYSSPEKRDGKPRKKTKAELKAELKEQKVKARKSQRQRVRNKRYLSDEFVFKSPPDSSMSQSYDETMLIEETVEMEIDTEPQTIELDSDTVQLLEIPLPQGQVQGPQQITMETVEGLEFTISQDDSEEVLGSIDGATFVTTDGQQFVQSVDFVVTQGDTDSAPGENMPTTRQRSREELKSGASSVGGDLSEDRTGSQESRKKRKRNVSQSSAGGGDKTSPTAGAIEKRQLRSSDSRADKHGKQPGSKQKYNSDELYKPRHSYSRRALSPPPLPSEPPPIPSDIAPPPLPPSPPPTDSSAPPPPPESPPMEPERSDRGRRSRRKRKNRSRSHSRPRSPKRHKRSSRSHSKPLSVSSGSLSSVSKRSHSSDSKKSYSRKRSKSRSLSSISSDSRRSRSYSKSRSYSRSRSRSRSSSRSRSRSVSRSRSRSISSISSKRSSFSKGSDISFEERERRRKARPLQDIDFGEAAKRARQDSMLPHFAPRGAMGHMGPMGHLGPGGHVGPRGPGSYQMRGMPHMPRGPRGMIRGRYPSPHHMSLDVPPVRAPSLSPSKTYYPPVGGPRYMPPSVAPWEDMHSGRSRQPMYPDDDYYPPEDIHEGPGKTGITERGTLYREDTSPSPPPERRPVYTPPPFREGAVSPPITGITERGTLYREDTSPSVPLPSFYGAVGVRPSPPPLRRRRGMEAEPSPPTIRTRLHPSTPSPPPIARRRTISNRSRSQESFESISPSPSPPPPQVMVKAQHFHRPPSPPEQMNTPPVLRRSRGLPASTPSPPSSGELTPSPPDLSHMRGGASPVSPVPMYPTSPRGPASPLESLTPSPPPGRERLEPVSPPSPPTPSRLRQGHPPEPSSPPTPSRQRQGQPPEPSSPHYSPESGPPPSLRRSSRNISSSEEEVHYTRSRRGQPPSPPALQRAHRRSLSPLVMPVVETRSRQARGEGKPKKHKRR